MDYDPKVWARAKTWHGASLVWRLRLRLLLTQHTWQVVSDILDYMFLPNFGLSLQILKV